MSINGLCHTGQVAVPDFGSALQRTRLLRGWSVPRLSQESGISIGTIKNCESGYPGARRGRWPDPERSTVISLAVALGVDPDDWLTLVDQPQLDPDERRLLDSPDIPPDVRRRFLWLLARMPEGLQQLYLQVGEAFANRAPDEERWETVFTGPVPADSPYQDEGDEEDETPESVPTDDDQREAN